MKITLYRKGSEENTENPLENYDDYKVDYENGTYRFIKAHRSVTMEELEKVALEKD
jgi:hypothetical protein